jgi:hypothetical protein
MVPAPMSGFPKEPLKPPKEEESFPTKIKIETVSAMWASSCRFF